jgi:hypothetical protein
MIRILRVLAAACVVLASACVLPAPAHAQLKCTFSKSAECTFLAACRKRPKATPAQCQCAWREVSKRFPENQHVFLAEIVDVMFTVGGKAAPSPEQQQRLDRVMQAPGFNSPFYLFTLIEAFDAAKRSCPNT